MQLVPSLLFGVSASLDALLVGVSYGVRGTHIRLLQNLFISLITLLGTCLSIGLGAEFALFLPPILSGCIGSLVLLSLGVYYIAKWVKASLQHSSSGRHSEHEAPPLTCAAQPSLCLTLPEVFFLSVSLSANNLGIGLSASMAGLTLAPAAAATSICSVTFLFLGNQLGRSRLLQLIGDLADPISGLLLIGLGLIQLFI